MNHKARFSPRTLSPSTMYQVAQTTTQQTSPVSLKIDHATLYPRKQRLNICKKTKIRDVFKPVACTLKLNTALRYSTTTPKPSVAQPCNWRLEVCSNQRTLTAVNPNPSASKSTQQSSHCNPLSQMHGKRTMRADTLAIYTPVRIVTFTLKLQYNVHALGRSILLVIATLGRLAGGSIHNLQLSWAGANDNRLHSGHTRALGSQICNKKSIVVVVSVILVPCDYYSSY